MMKLMIKCAMMMVPVLMPLLVSAQDIQLSQYYNVSPLMNPAFTGTSYAYRAILNSRIQWNQLDASYHTHIFAVDYNLHHYNSGIGMYFVHDEQSQGTVNRNEFALQYAYAAHLNEKVTLRLALQSAYNQRRLGRNFNFPNQFTGSGFDNNMPTIDQTNFENVNYVDFSSGALLFTERFWAGLSVMHLNRPNQSLFNGLDRIDRTYSVIVGYKFVLKEIPTMRYLESHNIEKVSITPTFQYKAQGRFDQFDAGIYGMYSQVILGVWYRGIPIKTTPGNEPNNESIIFLLGYRMEQFSISYSYDNVVSRLSGVAGGAHEFNLTFQFPKTVKRKKPVKFLPCPNFHSKH